jgi:DDE superfamily endonuclease
LKLDGFDPTKWCKTMPLKMIQNGRPWKQAGWYDELKLYYNNICNTDQVVTVGMMIYELKRLDPLLADVDTKVLSKRLYRCLRSEGNVQWHVTHVAQNTRYAVSVIDDFVVYVNEQIVSGNFGPLEIVNIDKTNIEFDTIGSTTLADQGSRTVSLRSTGSSSRCTVLLRVTLSVEKLPPFIIFKGKPNGQIAHKWTGTTGYPSTSIYAVQGKAWIDERTFLLWIEKVWQSSSSLKPHSYLIMDESTVHLRKSCLNAVYDCRTELDFIIQGYTSKLQVLDVGINKPFKDKVMQSYDEIMVKMREKGFTIGCSKMD